MGKQSKIKGMVNENRSVSWILNNPKYGVADKTHIYITPRLKAKHIPDLFSTPYRDSKGEVHMAGFDIAALGRDALILVQVKTNKKPSRLYMDVLASTNNYKYIEKELHIWVDGEDTPQIINLNL